MIQFSMPVIECATGYLACHPQLYLNCPDVPRKKILFVFFDPFGKSKQNEFFLIALSMEMQDDQ